MELDKKLENIEEQLRELAEEQNALQEQTKIKRCQTRNLKRSRMT